NEILASRHKDDNSVACIVDKCYVLSYPEYCRHRAATKRSQDSRISSATPVPPVEATHTTREHIPSTCDPKLLFFCRQIYDYRMDICFLKPVAKPGTLFREPCFLKEFCFRINVP
ncbi:bromo adjacent homology domain-containing 1, partial [Paramuricea clavata]